MTTTRQDWMSLLARAPADRLAALMAALGPLPAHDWLRPPETGGVMVRGRMGGTGGAFNLGEMTMTRCAVQLADGTVGHAYVQGRDKAHATGAALADALLQTARASEVLRAVIAPLASEAAERKALRARKAAATRVEFFTMVRGEDA